ncbi:hypothetical protein G7Y89_g10964 [Cudoniella acicularis]|uniref:NAD(P)-binding protein n=1 Tax=Cudoniella acicularis TaxID=354080 RepID=A0A8H4VYH7_9HELO|nr:hypothetical protein G7Y89_g10964 [Cudoniella acicularis]
MSDGSSVASPRPATPALSAEVYDLHFQRGFRHAATMLWEENLGAPPPRTQESPRVRNEKEAYRRGYNLAIEKAIIQSVGTDMNRGWTNWYLKHHGGNFDKTKTYPTFDLKRAPKSSRQPVPGESGQPSTNDPFNKIYLSNTPLSQKLFPVNSQAVMPQIYLIVGASRGIGLEFVRQLLARGDTVIATQRAASTATNPTKLSQLKESEIGKNLTILDCDVSNDTSIKSFTEEVMKLSNEGGILKTGVIDCVVLNAGVLQYPNRISEITSQSFTHHLTTNTIGPLLTASSLTRLPLTIHTVIFISSDSGSTINFLSYEDGFGAYSASKAALNQGLRHLSFELYRKSKRGEGQEKAPVVLALHPGEVSTDMAANVSLDWEVKGGIEPEESIVGMLKVIEEKGNAGVDEGGRVNGKVQEGEATFWTWDGRRYPW